MVRGAALTVSIQLIAVVQGHGHITWPPARNNGSFAKAGNSHNMESFWFSQPALIPAGTKPTLPAYARTYNTATFDGPADFTRSMPWRAPGLAPVLGSGCGVAGGNTLANMSGNGGVPPPGFARGQDFLEIPTTFPPMFWARGSTQEVAWAALANHGGGTVAVLLTALALLMLLF